MTLQNFGQIVIIGKIKESCLGAGYPILPAPATATQRGSEMLRQLCAAGKGMQQEGQWGQWPRAVGLPCHDSPPACPQEAGDQHL